VVKSLAVGVVVLDDEQRCVLVNEWVTNRAATVGHVVPGAVVHNLAGVECERLVGGDMREQATLGVPESTFVINAHSTGDGRETVVVISDITEERNQQAKAAHQDRLALIGQLAGGIAHDFNNLLCIIVSYVEMLQESLVDPQALDDIGMVSQAASSATDLVRQLLAFSRREAVKPKVIEVGRVVAAMETLLKRTVGRDIELGLEISAPHHQRVLMDPSQLEQIVMNLVVNARDAISGPGRVVVRVGATTDRVTLMVSDTGCGMAPDLTARIFEPYFTTKEIGKGTGLGLATVQGIVEHVRGDIGVTSAPGQGTTFQISLPMTDLAPEQSAPIPKIASGRVLLVDDDAQVRRLTERMLRHAGYDVHAVGSGPDALAELRRTSFDILLTDMVMPGMSGRDLAREVARDHPRTRIVFMSGYHPGTPIPAWQFIAKPFDRQTLLAKLGDLQAPASLSNVR
jgi:signal transduction histidine kinase